MSTDTIPFKSGGHPERDARLVKAAVRVDDVVYVGWRHATIMNDQLPRTRIDQDQQGFVDQYGNFYNRYRSARIALRAEQIKGIRADSIISEELWECDGTPTLPGFSPFNLMGDLPKCPSCKQRVESMVWQIAIRHKRCYECGCGTHFGKKGARYD